MTNEEKAKEIVEHIETNHPKNYNSDRKYSMIDASLRMAEWKDQQYTKILTKLIVELDELKHQIKSLLP